MARKREHNPGVNSGEYGPVLVVPGPPPQLSQAVGILVTAYVGGACSGMPTYELTVTCTRVTYRLST